MVQEVACHEQAIETLSARVLVVDDEPSIREMLTMALTGSGYAVDSVCDGVSALAAIEADCPDVVIQDLRMPGMAGTDLLGVIKERWPQLPVVVISAYSNWDNMAQSMQRGAFEYVRKPFDMSTVRHVLERALAEGRGEDSSAALPHVVGQAFGLEEAARRVGQVAATDAPLLLHGERGTGKEMLARLSHQMSARALGPFVSVTASVYSTERAFELDLFGGSEDGLDTQGLCQQADGGTLFVDEIETLPLVVQVKLLRLVEQKRVTAVGSGVAERVDVRFIGASSVDLAERVQAGSFRGDLFYRLNVIPVHLPPLRERKDDIPLLAGYFVGKYAAMLGKDCEGLSEEVQSQLVAYDWPGNVREFEGAIQRAVLLSPTPVIQDIPLGEALEFERAVSARRSASGELTVECVVGTVHLPTLPEGGVYLDTVLEDIERAYISEAIRRCGGNMTQAGTLLGLSFRQVRYKVKKLGLSGQH